MYNVYRYARCLIIPLLFPSMLISIVCEMLFEPISVLFLFFFENRIIIFIVLGTRADIVRDMVRMQMILVWWIDKKYFYYWAIYENMVKVVQNGFHWDTWYNHYWKKMAAFGGISLPKLCTQRNQQLLLNLIVWRKSIEWYKFFLKWW